MHASDDCRMQAVSACGSALSGEHLSHMLAGKQRGVVKAEPGAYQTRPALPQGRGLLAQPDCIATQQAKPSGARPLARPPAAGAAPAAKPVADKHRRCSPPAQPESINRQPFTSQGVGSLPGQQTRKQAPAAQGRSSNGPGSPEARKEAVILLEEAGIDWDLGDLQKVQQRARDAPSALQPHVGSASSTFTLITLAALSRLLTFSYRQFCA